MKIIDEVIQKNKLVLAVRPEIEYDEYGNPVHYKDAEGTEIWREFDTAKNVVHYRNSNGFEYWKEYEGVNVIRKLELRDGVWLLDGVKMEVVE